MLNDPHLSPIRLLEVHAVAHRLSVSQRFVWGLIRDGKLAAIRLGTRWRVDPHDLQAFIEQRRVAIAQAERDLDKRLGARPNGDETTHERR